MLGRYSYVSCLERALGNAETVLDLGCGNNSPIGRFKRRPRFAIGVDLFEPFLEESRQKRIHDEYRVMDVLDIERAFGRRSFDAVVACDLLEHLEAANGSRLLCMMEQVARRRIVVLTPNGFLPQGETWGNPFQRHRSGWTPKQMRELGYDVVGVNGLRTLRGERGLLRWQPQRLWGVISEISRPLVYSHPNWAFHILCVKQLEKR
jgi:SAM-dependent methyltransferase